MASLQMLKSPVAPFSIAQSNSCRLKLNSKNFGRRLYIFQSKNRRLKLLISHRPKVSCKLQDGENQNNGEEPPESLFMKELRRRGMTPTSLLEESNRTTIDDQAAKFMEEDGGFSRRNALSTDAGRNLSNQREQSMALNSEGLEGLIPRAKLLLSLGGTFFLAFGPLILITVAFFSALYLYFGPSFVHDGSRTPISPPQYVDPYALLEEERIMQSVPRLN